MNSVIDIQNVIRNDGSGVLALLIAGGVTLPKAIALPVDTPRATVQPVTAVASHSRL